MTNIVIDPAVKAPKPFRNILGMNNQPVIEIKRNFDQQRPWVEELHLRHFRHHDAALDNPGIPLVDVSKIFPLFHLDENDPKNYCFGPTDDYFSTVADLNPEIDFRLGECIDHSGFHWFIQPPKDVQKWARICRNIIAHYKNGENNGMHLNITRITVWEESDNPKLFAGTVEQYTELFCAIYKLFKQEFPDLQIGGPTLCAGNYPYLDRFLALCKENCVIPDFVTITQYYRDLEAIPNTLKVMRELLDKYSFFDTKIVISEWHLGPKSWETAGDLIGNGFHSSMSAAYSAATLIRIMDFDSLDIAFFYAWSNGIWGVFSNVWPRVRRPVYFGLQFFNDLAVGCAERLEVGCRDADVLAGKTADGKVRLLVSCFETEAKSFCCNVKGAVSCTMKAARSEYVESDCTEGVQLLPNAEGGFEFAQEKAGSDVFLLEFTLA